MHLRRAVALVALCLLIAAPAMLPAQTTAAQLAGRVAAHIVDCYTNLGYPVISRFDGLVTVAFDSSCSPETRASVAMLLLRLNALLGPEAQLQLRPGYSTPVKAGTRNTIVICEGQTGLAVMGSYASHIPSSVKGLAAFSASYGRIDSAVVWVNVPVAPESYALTVKVDADYNTLMHELLHALGMAADSSDNHDVMHYKPLGKGFSETEYFAIQVLYRLLQGGETRAEAQAIAADALLPIFAQRPAAALASYHP